MNLVEGLTDRLNVVISSRTESDFYVNVYHYFDYLFKNQELADLYHLTQTEYGKKFGDIWADYNDKRRAYLESGRTIESPQITDEPMEVSRMEKSDTYSMGVGSEVRIYYPIKHFYECDKPGECGEYNGMLLLYGLDYTLKNYKGNLLISQKEIKETFKNWFKGQRDYYQGELSQFHMMFTSRYESLNGAVVVPSTDEIIFDAKNSLLILGDKKVRVSLRANPPVEHYVLEYIFENDGVGEKAFFSEILEEKFGQDKDDWRKIHKACQRLEAKILKDSGLKNILVYNTGITAAVTISPPR